MKRLEFLGFARTRFVANRYYDPATAQFMSVDPAVATTGAPYYYAGGDPVNGSDPSGLCTSLFNIVCVGGGSVSSTLSFRFDPGAGANATVNVGRGASFGLSDTIANWISPGASCTVAGNALDQGIGAAAGVVISLGPGLAADAGEAGIQATAHGAEQLAARGFSTEDIAVTLRGQQLTQADGAAVYLAETAPGKFNVIVVGDRGVVTALKDISEGAVNRLAKNYGWSG